MQDKGCKRKKSVQVITHLGAQFIHQDIDLLAV